MSDTIHTTFRNDALAGRFYGVTGAAHGIGEATARSLLNCGAGVLLIDIDQKNLDRVQADLTDAGDQALVACADVADVPRMTEAIERAVSRWGRLDGWVNNALYGARGLINQQPREQFVRNWEVNVLAAWEITRLILPHLKRAGGGSIVNISSVMAQQTIPGAAAYTSSKSALEGLTRALAVELAPQRIRVNCIAPGFILTCHGFAPRNTDPELAREEEALNCRIEEMLGPAHGPWPDVAMPQRVAEAVVFLLSDAAGFISGATLPVDGALSVDLRTLDDRRHELYLQIRRCREELERVGKGKTESKG